MGEGGVPCLVFSLNSPEEKGEWHVEGCLEERSVAVI